MKQPEKCYGCGVEFSLAGGQRNHGKYSTACTEEMRFWGRVKKTETCWMWLGAVKGNGYGAANCRADKNVSAHRYSWLLAHGPVPEGMNVLHRCDVRLCVNPAHLFVGTQGENMRDMRSKGRSGCQGERNWSAKLTAQDVLTLRQSPPDSYEEVKELARKYGCKPSSINNAISGRTWKHLATSN